MKKGLLVLVLILVFMLGSSKMAFGEIVEGNPVRGHDDYGSGAFGAPRGSRKHKGVDIVAKPGQEIKVPISGKVTSITRPYKDDLTYKGLWITGNGKFQGVKVRIWYIDFNRSLVGQNVEKGQVIGMAQDLTKRYHKKGTITNHIHYEVYLNGKLVNPTKYL